MPSGARAAPERSRRAYDPVKFILSHHYHSSEEMHDSPVQHFPAQCLLVLPARLCQERGTSQEGKGAGNAPL